MAFEIEKDWITNAGLRAVVLVVINNMGEKYGSYKSHRCGYVGVPKEHPAFDKGYDDMDIDCHGGLTFSSSGDKYPVESDLHWFGFDCHHYLDKQIEPNPALPLAFAEEGEVRSLDYCIAECESIANQLMHKGESDGTD